MDYDTALAKASESPQAVRDVLAELCQRLETQKQTILTYENAIQLHNLNSQRQQDQFNALGKEYREYQSETCRRLRVIDKLAKAIRAVT